VWSYQSWFASPLLDFQANPRARVQNRGAPLLPPCCKYLELPQAKHVMRSMSRFHFRVRKKKKKEKLRKQQKAPHIN